MPDDVAGDDLEGTGAAHAVAGQLGGPGRRDRGEGRLGHRDQAGQHHQAGREDDQLKVGKAGGGAGRE